MTTDPKSFFLTTEIQQYINAHNPPIDTIQRNLIEKTRALGPMSIMQVAPDQGAFLTLLTQISGAQQAVEIGTFTGYSGLCIARGLPEDGNLICCDISEEWTGIAKEAWEAAGISHKIELRVAPALESVRAMPDQPFIDLAFIDADKTGYIAYHEEIVPRLRQGGLLLADNVLWNGKVCDPAANDEATTAIRAYNAHAAGDKRVDHVMLTIADGLTIMRKR